jgi:hypothetical protein
LIAQADWSWGVVLVYLFSGVDVSGLV